MKAWWWLGIGATLLLASVWATTRVGPPAGEPGLSRTLWRLPLSNISRDGAVFRVRLPATPQWEELHQSWGEPGVLVFVAMTDSSVLEFSSAGTRVEVTGPHGRLPVEPARGAPFGRVFLPGTAEYGVRFRGKPGDDLILRVSTHEPEALAHAELAGMYEWGPLAGTDHRLAFGVARLLHALGEVAALAGAVAIALGVELNRRAKLSIASGSWPAR
jgi:hypothetical protein